MCAHAAAIFSHSNISPSPLRHTSLQNETDTDPWVWNFAGQIRYGVSVQYQCFTLSSAGTNQPTNMRGVSFKPQDAEDFSTGEIKSYGGIYAATAEDFAGAFEMDPNTFIDIVQSSDVEPLTEVGDDDEPGKYSLSFEREEFEKLKELLLEEKEDS